MKVGIDKIYFNELDNVLISLNNSKTKVDDLDVVKIKAFLLDLKKLSDVVDNEVEKRILDSINLIHINQYNTEKKKKKLAKEMEMLIKNTRYKWFNNCNCLEYKN